MSQVASPAAPVSGTSVILPVLTQVATNVTDLERTAYEEQWLPENHIAKHGVVSRDRKDGCVWVYRGWHSFQSTMRAPGAADQTDLTHLRRALIELAAGAVKFAADIDVHLSKNAALPVDAGDPLAGLVPPTGARGPGGDADDDE